MKQTRFLLCFPYVVFLLYSLQCGFVYGSQIEGLSSGTMISQFTLPSPDSDETRDYLGLKAMGPFTLSNIDSKLVLIELLSVTCGACNLNAPISNRLYNVIRKDAFLAGDIKMIGIAFGNNEKEIFAFKNRYKIRYPIFPDEECAIATMLGVMETPGMVLATTDGKVLTSHGGMIRDFDGFLKELRDICKKQ